jgi:hypothetical protein
MAEFNAMEATPEFAGVRDHIRLRRDTFQDNYRRCVKSRATSVRRQVEEQLGHDEVWDRCADEWGRGSGFKGRVRTHLEGWRLRHYDELTAHEARGFRGPNLLEGPDDPAGG